jgi:DNA-directed RNA polymerase subunit E'
MYYLTTIEERVRVPPSMFGSKLDDAVLRILQERFERRIFKDVGMMLLVVKPKVSSDGVVIPGDGGAYYSVQFDALTFIPQVNEVYEAEVKEIVEFGAFASIGPFQGLLHVSQIGREKYFYDKKNKSLVSRAEKKSVKKGDSILVKVSTVSLKSTTTDTKIGLTMRPDGLGKTEWMTEAKVVKKEPKKKEQPG